MEMLRELPDDPVVLQLMVVLLGVLVLLYIVKGMNSKKTAELQIIQTLLTQNGEQLTEMKALREDEQTREDRAQTRHEAILAAFQGFATGLTLNTTEVKTLGQQIGKLDTTMSEHIDNRPAILDEIREIKRMIQAQNSRLDAFVSNATKEAGEMKRGLAQVTEKTVELEKRITTETPIVNPAPPPMTIGGVSPPPAGASKTTARRSNKIMDVQESKDRPDTPAEKTSKEQDNGD